MKYKSGFVYLLVNSKVAKVGATKSSIKNRIYFFNKNNPDKFRLICFVKSSRPFKEENNFRWFLNSHHEYFGVEAFHRTSTHLFEEFFRGRILDG